MLLKANISIAIFYNIPGSIDNGRGRKMFLAVPAKLESVDGAHAVALSLGVRQFVNVSLIDNPQPGDYVMVNAGTAIEKMDKND